METINQKYSIESVLKLRDRLKNILRTDLMDRTLDRDNFAKLFHTCTVVLPARLDPEVIELSLQPHAGVPLTEELIDNLAHRLAGNIPRLASGRAVTPWVRQLLPEWVPLQVVRATPEVSKIKRIQTCRFLFKVMAGTPASAIIEKVWTVKYCRFLARFLGFRRRRPAQPAKYLFRDPRQFVTLRLRGLITPELSLGAPLFEIVDCPGSLKKWNFEQIKYQERLDPGYECPQGFPREWRCEDCHMGYRDCRGGKHAMTYTQGLCEGCWSSTAFFDPEQPSELCILCTNRRK